MRVKKLYEIPDRRQAIELALSLARTGDTVVITGKGHEKSINTGTREIPWSDHEIVKKILTSL